MQYALTAVLGKNPYHFYAAVQVCPRVETKTVFSIFAKMRKFSRNFVHFRFRENFRYFRKLFFAKSKNKFSRKYENENFRFNPSVSIVSDF
jgi:hypothetical protein